MRFASRLGMPRAELVRIERLARRAHAFHRFAHHPLCSRYAGELVVLRGRTRICRGCSCALAGALLGAFTLLSPLPIAAAIGLTLMAAGLLLAPLRGPKLLTRAFPFAVLSANLLTPLTAAAPAQLALAALSLTAAALWLTRYRRRRPDRTPCSSCPERELSPCSGFSAIVRAERAFVRRSHQVLDFQAARSRASWSSS